MPGNVCWLSAGWSRWGQNEPVRMIHLSSLSFSSNRLDLASSYQQTQDSLLRDQEWKLQDLLNPGLRNYAVSTLLLFLVEVSQSQLRFKKWGNRFHSLMEEVKSHCKEVQVPRYEEMLQSSLQQYNTCYIILSQNDFYSEF